MLSEIERINQLKSCGHDLVRVTKLAQIESQGLSLPLMAIAIGTEDPSAPTLGLFAGVHGLERVGSAVVMAYLESLNEELKWNCELALNFKKIRLLAIPVINPIGMAKGWRSNGNGIDLMRNAPVDAREKTLPFVGGHRWGSWLPYFRGEKLEQETAVVMEFCKTQLLPSRAALSIDFHSGFGVFDRFWYPYAKTRADFPDKFRAERIHKLLNRTLPYHIYHVEAQSQAYLTHGDLWDYLYDFQKTANPKNLYIPWALEMGSWSWIKKNPSHAFRIKGVFDPIKPHRRNRMMRRHMPLINFFQKVCLNPDTWTQ